jgi:hypothetical protein
MRGSWASLSTARRRLTSETRAEAIGGSDSLPQTHFIRPQPTITLEECSLLGCYAVSCKNRRFGGT